MSSRLRRSITVSWFLLTILFVLACFAGAYVLCEWLIRRRRDANDNDRDSLA